MAIALNYVAVC